MFNFLKDTAKLFGSITGSIIGVPVGIVAATLGITVEMVNEALKAGCESYEEIKDFYKNH